MSRLNYGLCVWDNICVSYLHPPKVMHNKGIRVLANADYYACVPHLARKLNIIKFDDLYFFQISVFMYKMFHNVLPQSFLKCCVNTSSI